VRLITIQVLSVSGALVFGAAGCGSSSSSSHSTSTPATTSTAAASSGRAAVTTGPVHAKLTAPDHSPKVGKGWPYSVHVTDAQGHPLSGTVKIEFAYGGQVVGTDHPAVHPLRDGVWHDILTFPKEAVGYPLTFQVVVHTSAGSVLLGWPVMVHP